MKETAKARVRTCQLAICEEDHRQQCNADLYRHPHLPVSANGKKSKNLNEFGVGKGPSKEQCSRNACKRIKPSSVTDRQAGCKELTVHGSKILRIGHFAATNERRGSAGSRQGMRPFSARPMACVSKAVKSCLSHPPDQSFCALKSRERPVIFRINLYNGFL